MATKSASHRYLNTRGSKRNKPNEKIGFPWAKAFNKHTLKIHFTKHKKDFNISDIKHYLAKSIVFANTADYKNNVSFVDKNGTTYKYSLKTNEFAIITKEGIIITYFKPKDGYKYYLNEKEKNKKI